MTTTDTTCNGWTNYATWRVNLEIFDGFDPDGQVQTAEGVKEMADDAVSKHGELEDGLALDYARAFMDAVNWQEIADAINENYELADPEEEEEQ